MYDTGKLLYLLSNILGDYKKFANHEVYFNCPLCHHKNKKLAINVAKGMWHCWVCGARGGKLLSLFRKLDVSPDQIKDLSILLEDEVPYLHEDEVVGDLCLPPEFIPLWEASSSVLHRHAMVYLKKRNILLTDIIRYRIGYCESGQYANRIIVPSYDHNHKLNYFVGRSMYDSQYKYKNPPVSKNVIGFENQINFNYPVVLSEGVFDAIAVRRNAIPLFGKSLSPKLRKKLLTQNIKLVYVALDSDALKESTYISQFLVRNGIDAYFIELDKKDPSELGFKKIEAAIKSSKKLNFKNILEMKMNAGGL